MNCISIWKKNLFVHNTVTEGNRRKVVYSYVRGKFILTSEQGQTVILFTLIKQLCGIENVGQKSLLANIF